MIRIPEEGLQRLRDVREVLATQPHQFLMVEVEREDERDPLHCGTVCCLAGWLHVLDRRAKNLPPASEGTISEAAKLLGILGHQDWLFYVDGWPEDYQRQYDWRADDDDAEAYEVNVERMREAREDNAGLACRLLDSVLEAGGLWWVDEPDPEECL